MKIIGLTGGIGTGKSTAEEIFKRLGAYVIDADSIVHQLYKQEHIKEKLKQIFTEDIFDNNQEIDRKKVARIVFSDKTKRKALEEIIHPEVNKYIDEWLNQIEKNNPDAVAIVSVPLMIETGSYKKYQKIILVYAPKELQIERLIKKGYSYEEAVSRINAQMDIEEKLKYADYVIINTSTLENLENQVKRVFDEIKKDS